MNRIPLIVRKSIWYSFSIITGINTIVGLWGYTIKDINENLKWWQCGLALFIGFILLSLIVFLVLNNLKHKEYSTL